MFEQYENFQTINSNKSFLLELEKIPDIIILESNEFNFTATGKNGLYSVSEFQILLKKLYSLIELYKMLPDIEFSIKYGYLKQPIKYLAPHPISGKITEWTPQEAYEICRKLNYKRIPELESVIAKDAYYSYSYAYIFIKGRFIEAEPIISEDSECSYRYAKDILNERFETGESKIAKDSMYSFLYAKFVLENRFELGEPAIKKSHIHNVLYDTLLSHGMHSRVRIVSAENALSNFYCNKFFDMQFQTMNFSWNNFEGIRNNIFVLIDLKDKFYDIEPQKKTYLVDRKNVILFISFEDLRDT